MPSDNNKFDFTMLSRTELSRRGFLQSAGIATGGLLVGLVGPAGCAGEQATAPLVATNINAYVRISSNDEISIVVPGAELGQGIYTGLPKIIAEELEADWGRVVVRLATADESYINPKKKRQSTGNSDAVMGYFDALRNVGAATREMLLSAAAEQWQLPHEECRAELSRVYHDASGQSLSYGDLAEAAASLPIPVEPPLKSRDQYTLLGKSLPRKDSLPKVTGSAIFGADVRLPEQLFASIKTSPVFGGRVKSIQYEDVAAQASVFKVVELEDGVAVLAESFWEANTALQEIDVEFEFEENASWNSEQISASLQSALDDEAARPFPGAKGDAKSIIAAADDVFEATYEVPFLAHVCMEPMTATAHVTETSCRIWAPHQRQYEARVMAAELTGLAIEQVSLQGTFCGGGFGRKWELDFIRQALLLAQRADGRPVTLIWSREQDVAHDFYRPAVASRARGTLDDAGKLVALHTRAAGPSLMTFQGRPLPIPDPTIVRGSISSVYNIANTLMDYVETNTHIPLGFWRAVSLSHNGFIGESIIDELAHRAGRDPLEFRLQMFGENLRARAVLEKVAEVAGWGKTLGANTGMGVAFSSGFGSLNAQIAEVTVIDDQLKIERITCVHDCGFAIDPDAVRAQMEGGIIDGLSAALFSKITIANGAVEQSNFHDYRFIRMAEVPDINVHLISSDAAIGGVGEAGLPATAPAVANAIFAAIGKRIRRLPIADAGFRVAVRNQGTTT
jgi:isoquinoline 1-oxidoreductase beta subunit